MQRVQGPVLWHVQCPCAPWGRGSSPHWGLTLPQGRCGRWLLLPQPDWVLLTSIVGQTVAGPILGSKLCPALLAGRDRCCTVQERLAPSAVTHRILTLHPYNTRQQTGMAGQQLNKCEIMPGKCTPTENNCDCAQAVMEYLKA